MPRYNICGQLGQDYRIEIAGDDGVRQTMLGFASEKEAADWIQNDKQNEQRRQSNRS